MKKVLISIVLIFSISSQSFSQNGKLGKAKESLTEKTTSSSGSKTLTSKRTRNDSDTTLGGFFAGIVMRFAYFVTYGIAIESIAEKDSKMHFSEISEYPYKTASFGNFIYTDSTNYALARLDVSNNFVIKDHNLYGNNLNLDFRFFRRMGFEVDYLQLFEKVGTTSDSFSLFSAMLNYHRIRTQKLDFWFGLGTMYVGNDVHKFGFSVGVGAEWFIKKPISLVVSHKGASINHQSVNKTKVLLKYHLKKYHISSGYEYFVLGVSSIDAFSLGIGITF